jgi:hypothetical protein
MNKIILIIFSLITFFTVVNAIAKQTNPERRGLSLVCPSGYINSKYFGVYNFDSEGFTSIRNDIVPNADLIKSQFDDVAMWDEGSISPSNAFVYKIDSTKGKLSRQDEDAILGSLINKSDSDLKLNAIRYSLSFKSMTYKNRGPNRYDSSVVNLYKLNSDLLGFNYLRTGVDGIRFSNKDIWYDPESQPIIGENRKFTFFACDDNLFSLYSGAFFSLIKTNNYGEKEKMKFLLFIKSSVNPINETTNPEYFK